MTKEDKAYRQTLRTLRAVREVFLSDHKACHMGRWLVKADFKAQGLTRPTRRIAGCIGGWYDQLSNGGFDPWSHKTALDNHLKSAGLCVDLTTVFYPEYWPEPLCGQLKKTAPQSKAHARLAVQRIDLLIKELKQLKKESR